MISLTENEFYDSELGQVLDDIQRRSKNEDSEFIFE